MSLNKYDPATAQPAADDEAWRTVRFVLDTFKRDLENGYRTKDKEFAVDLLTKATSAAPAHVAAGAKLAALEEALNALRPLSDAVYNDNGDMTVSVPIVSAEECIIAYLAVKRIRSALACETEN